MCVGGVRPTGPASSPAIAEHVTARLAGEPGRSHTEVVDGTR